MTQTCPRCARANPSEARYCYFDGSVLGAPGSNGGPVHTGTQPFHHLFTFPSGRVCRNFDELALACQENWAEAVELLRQGYLETFLGGLGRADLALAAREAASFPDHDRGLDQLLAKLPSDVIDAPALLVEPLEVNLGELRVGEDRELTLHLANQGMRLLYGTVTCADCVWLAVGEGQGAPQKMFQFGGELAVPVRVRGQQLRAENNPLEGRLLVESNGGAATVVVRAAVPVKPFPDGLFAGARTPRQIAELAKAHLKINVRATAAPFEAGAVARWYADNGWTYPVEGPVAAGAAAVQQFFDALGLARPPRVELSAPAVTLQGNVGVEVRYALEIRTEERRPIYAHATSDQPWLEIGPTRLDNRTATLTLPLVVPRVPDREGETLTAKVAILANGQQRFTVPVTLEVGGNFNFTDFPAEPEEEPDELPSPAAPAKPTAPEKFSPPNKAVLLEPFRGPRWPHAIPAALLALALAGVVGYDLTHPRDPKVPPTGGPGGRGVELVDPEPRLGIKFDDRMSFGIVMLKETDPDNPRQHKRLTAKDDGSTNNTCVRIDGDTGSLIGQPPGDWAQNKHFQSLKQVELGNGRIGWTSTWDFPLQKIRVRQTVEIVPGEQTQVLDTCLVHYLILNWDTIPHQVGLRVLLDTFIGGNDAVPFAVPGEAKLLEKMRIFDGPDIPDYVEALERPDPADPGTVAHLGLKLPNARVFPSDPEPEPLERVVICRWPGKDKRWEWDYKAITDHLPDEQNDSCAVLYWETRPMEPKARRALAFTYGLGRISGSSGGRLGVTAGGSFQPGKAFTVTAYIKDPAEGQKVKLVLPPGLSLDGDDRKEERDVTLGGEYAQVSWRVRAEAEGTYLLEVSSGLERQHHRVRVRKAGLFD